MTLRMFLLLGHSECWRGAQMAGHTFPLVPDQYLYLPLVRMTRMLDDLHVIENAADRKRYAYRGQRKVTGNSGGARNRESRLTSIALLCPKLLL